MAKAHWERLDYFKTMTKSDKDKGKLYLPKVYISSHTKIPSKSVETITLEDLIGLVRITDIGVKTLLIDYSIILITLLWAVQVLLNTDLIVNTRTKNNSKQKTYQQTESHSVMTKIVAASESSKRIISLLTTQVALNKEHFGKFEGETDDEGFKNALNNSLTALIENRGSGTTKVNIKDPETRLSWMKAYNSSIRSTWCATAVYSPNKLASSGVSIKTIKTEEIKKFLINTFNEFRNNDLINEDEKPTFEEIIESLKETINKLNIATDIDDTAFGHTKFVALDELLNIQRETMIKKSDEKIKMPGIAYSLKSRHIKTNPKKSGKNVDDEKKKEATTE